MTFTLCWSPNKLVSWALWQSLKLITVNLHSNPCFYLLVPTAGCLRFTVLNDVQYLQRLILQGYFLIYLLKVERFSALIKNHILAGWPSCMICDITNSLEANPGPILSFNKCDVETSSLQGDMLWIELI